MDLMTLAAKIVLDDSGYTKGVADAEKAGSGLAQKMGSMTVAVGQLAADMIRTGFNAIKNVIGGAMDNFGQYEQLVGGVETLFKESASRVEAYAKQSFKTTGLSANQYMETVTSFSASLIKGVKGDTDRAAELANMAVTDMADNANKMGTDISSIQAAYQGFAKQNYTMLDNLKLGYGGTASEMVRLINDSGTLDKKIKSLDGITFDQIVEALHAVQTEMGITGTTSKEAASTLEGSKNAMKAAWEDLLGAVAGSGDKENLDKTFANFKESFATYMENFIPTLSSTIANSGTLVDAIAESISALPTTLLTELAENGLEAGTDMIGAIGNITGWIIDSITNFFKEASLDPTTVQNFGSAIGEFVGTTLADLITNAPTILAGAVSIGASLATSLIGGLIDGLKSGFINEDTQVSKITETMQEAITDVNVNSTEAQAIISYLDSLKAKYGDAASSTTAWKDAVSALDEILPGAGESIAAYAEDLSGALETASSASEQIETLKTLEQKYGQGARNSKAWKKAVEELDAILPGAKETINSYGRDVQGAIDTMSAVQEKLNLLQEIGAQYGEGATSTEEWKTAISELNEILPGAGEVFQQYGADVGGAVAQLKLMNEELRQAAITNALTKAASGEIELLATQKLERNKLQNTYDRNAGQQQQYMQNFREEVKAAAGQLAESYKTFTEATGTFNKESYDGLINLSNGLSEMGNLDDLDFDQLQDILGPLKMLGGMIGKDFTDDLNQSLETNKKLYAEAQTEMDVAKSRMDALDTEIAATEAAIAETNAALAQTATEMLGSGELAASSVETGGDAVEAALLGAAASIGAVSFGPGAPRPRISYTPSAPLPHKAIGMDSVPYNGFRASLHKGEMILTAREASEYRRGNGATEMATEIRRMRQDLRNMQMVVDGEPLGRTVVKYGGERMSNYIGGMEARELAGYGW